MSDPNCLRCLAEEGVFDDDLQAKQAGMFREHDACVDAEGRNAADRLDAWFNQA